MKSKDFSQRLKMPPWGKKFPLRVWLQGGFWKHASMERTNWKVGQQNKERPTTYKWSRRKSKHLPYRAFLNQYIAISTTEPYNDSASQKHPRAGKISATEIRREGDLGSHQSSMGCLKNPSSSAVRSKLQTEFKDVSKTSERYTEGPAVACGVSPEGQDDIWVDSYIFRYIKTFHKKELGRCFAGTDLSVRYVVETDLMQISLTEQQRSKVTSGVQKAIQKLKTLFEF